MDKELKQVLVVLSVLAVVLYAGFTRPEASGVFGTMVLKWVTPAKHLRIWPQVPSDVKPGETVPLRLMLWNVSDRTVELQFVVTTRMGRVVWTSRKIRTGPNEAGGSSLGFARLKPAA